VCLFPTVLLKDYYSLYHAGGEWCKPVNLMAFLSQCGQLCLQDKNPMACDSGDSGTINNIDMEPDMAVSYFYLLDSANE